MEKFPGILRVKTRIGTQVVRLCEIAFIKGKNIYADIYLLTEEILETNHSLQWFEIKLPSRYYCRCHRSYMVNLNYVKCHNSTDFILADESRVRISRSKKASAYSRYDDFIKDKYETES